METQITFAEIEQHLPTFDQVSLAMAKGGYLTISGSFGGPAREGEFYNGYYCPISLWAITNNPDSYINEPLAPVTIRRHYRDSLTGPEYFYEQVDQLWTRGFDVYPERMSPWLAKQMIYETINDTNLGLQIVAHAQRVRKQLEAAGWIRSIFQLNP